MLDSETLERKPVAINRTAELVASYWENSNGVLAVEGHRLPDLLETFGSPLYVYSARILRQRYQLLQQTLGNRIDIYFSVKANPNPAILEIFSKSGAGLEIASAAEYVRARRAGVEPSRILFAGPGKTDEELRYVVQHGIGEIHLESLHEIERLDKITNALDRTVSVSVRVNPATHVQGGAMRMGGGATAFGFDEALLSTAFEKIRNTRGLHLVGVHLFAGTQILKAETLIAQWKYGISLVRDLRRQNIPLRTLDLGGGLGVPYFEKDTPLDLEIVSRGVEEIYANLDTDPDLKDLKLMVEPGRFLAGPAGVYATSVTSVKSSHGEIFTVTDGGMHHHLAATGNLGQVIKKDYPVLIANRLNEPHDTAQKIVGPLCTPLDNYGRKTVLPHAQLGDTVAILQSGAYGLSSSPVGFLSHPMPAEVLVDGASVKCIRERGTFEQPITPLP